MAVAGDAQFFEHGGFSAVGFPVEKVDGESFSGVDVFECKDGQSSFNMYVGTVRNALMFESIEMFPNPQARLVLSSQVEDLLFQFQASEALGVNLVNFDSFGVNFIEFQNIALKLALAGEFLKLEIKLFFKVAVGGNIFDESGIILRKLLLFGIAIDQGFAEENEFILFDDFRCLIFILQDIEYRHILLFFSLLKYTGRLVLPKLKGSS